VSKRNIGIRGTGFSMPERILSNKDLETMVNTNDEWIMDRTGIRERRILAEGQNASDIGAEAGRRAIANAGLDARRHRPRDYRHV
jgi:3-oxoacyl-[acyl-carrier-protein] synthase-3